ncbi:Uncharacterised protein [Salmonella enterica subsp. arizonae]|uniref:Uncharacterized protein n=1 Tax=Salmonella enterica subsp. arizonae TaxID=59203 RepID=A0A2X4T6A3_SALER|nr:Uncharacterised protein [Salmonella enterica subsp. arizonae]
MELHKMNGKKCQGSDHRIRQHMTQDNVTIADAKRLCGAI